jgi:putative ABC transport system substrate-binding protein
MSQTPRRQFLVAAGALIASQVAIAQPFGRAVRLGLLDLAGEDLMVAQWGIFRDRLRELGYVEYRNLVIERRSAGGAPERLPALAAELVGLEPDLIVASGTPETLALMKVTKRIPIVFTTTGDAVATGMVASLARPGGNVTGQSSMYSVISAKWIQLLVELVPAAKRIAFLGPTSNQAIQANFRSMQATARSLGITVQLLDASSPEAIASAFETMAAQKFDGFMVAAVGQLLASRQQIVELAARHRLPAIYAREEFVEAGGLLSFGISVVERFRGAAEVVDRILRGAKPAEMPVEQPTKFELVINLKTARALGLKIPQSILLRADRVIE